MVFRRCRKTIDVRNPFDQEIVVAGRHFGEFGDRPLDGIDHGPAQRPHLRRDERPDAAVEAARLVVGGMRVPTPPHPSGPVGAEGGEDLG